MKKALFTVLSVVYLITVWSCPSVRAFEIVTRDMVEKKVVVINDLVRTTDNFIVLFDTSSTTNQMVPGKSISKIQAAKKLLEQRNQWLPQLGYKAGLYIYTNFETLTGTFKEVYPVQAYNRARFAAAIEQLPEKGQGPAVLQAGLRGLRKAMAGLTGKTTIFMFTDGIATRSKGIKSPQQIVQELAQEHNICFYLISSATGEVNARLLKTVSQINTCSRVIPISLFLDNPNFFTTALFTVRTTSYVKVKPVKKVVGFTTNDILFDFDSAAIRKEYYERANMLGTFLKRHPKTYVVAAGYTDSIGDREYNLHLSQRRVQSLKDYLAESFGIHENRILMFWFGKFNPVADNSTREGRQLNRRVEIAVDTFQ